jgi:crotonobetaine/carnitine-CoA ligase
MSTYRERFGIETFPQAYGTSEAMTIFEAPDDGTPWQGSALGRPVSHYEVQLVDDRGIEVPVGEIGEICLRPRHPDIMFDGYFGDADATLRSSRNFWHHVGDTAYRDEEGIFYFAGRKKDYIRFKGRNIALGEVEVVAEQHPGLSDVSAFGVQSSEIESESELALAVVRKPGSSCSALEIAEFIAANAPYYLVPRYIDVRDTMPLNGHGRVVKDELAKKSAFSWDAVAAGYKPPR